MNGALHQLQSASDRSFGLVALFHLLIEEVPEGAGQRAASEGGKPEIVGVKFSVQSRFLDLNRNNIESPKFEIEFRIDPELQQNLEALFDRTPGDRLRT